MAGINEKRKPNTAFTAVDIVLGILRHKLRKETNKNDL